MIASMWSDPLVVYVAATAAVALALIEVALPTVGVAGLASLGTATIAALGLADGSHPWWPFVLIGLGFVLWAVELVRSTALLRWPALGAFATGSAAFGIATSDIGTIVAAAVISILFGGGFAPLAGAMTRLNSAPSTVGMESLVGTTGTVDRWDNGRGTVMVEGSRWSAVGPPLLQTAAAVRVTGSEGMTLRVTNTTEPSAS